MKLAFRNGPKNHKKPCCIVELVMYNAPKAFPR